MQPLPTGKQRLATVLRTAGDVIKIDHAVEALSLTRTEAAQLLSRWTSQGWLRRVGRGAYVPASLESLGSEHVLADPWVLVPALFAPAYIGGWTAAEEWDLTEQLFREIVVMTGQPVREKHQTRHGADFLLHHTQEDKIFGTKAVWRGNSKILVSDVHRTIIDMLNDPALGGGIQHVSDCLTAYFQRSDRDEKTLVAYADRLGNGAIFKRLGFLIEQHPDATELAGTWQSRITKGNAKLDPTLECSRLVSRWNLWVPPTWTRVMKA